MFRPNRCLLFRPISSLGHFKIHQPLPMSPREATQLLKLLTSSFRQQLDREHGIFRSETETASEPSASNSSSSRSSPSKRRKHLVMKQEPGLPTDRHLYAILTNPLFSYHSENSAFNSSSSRDPMTVFDEAYAKGFMKVEYARACLKAKKNFIVQSPVLSVQAGMKDSGAGAKVLKWLISSGVEKGIAFLQDDMFSGILFEFLVAEELEEVIWNWIERSLQEQWSSGTRDVTVRMHLLYQLVKSQSSGVATLDIAYQSMARAEKLLTKLNISSRRILSRPGCFLSHESTIKSSVRQPPSKASFDTFLALVPKFTSVSDLHLSHLHLHHPTHPDADPALQYLKKAQRLLSPLFTSMEEDASAKFQRRNPEWRIICIGLDAAKFLLERDQYSEARWVMDFLQNTFPGHLGMEERRQIDQAKAEASSLELLQTLNLA